MKINKLEAYLGMASSLFGAGALQGQVIYTDFNPDVVLDFNNSPVSFMLDIDQDGTNDIEIKGNAFSSTNADTITNTIRIFTTNNGNYVTYTYTYTYWSYSRQVTRFWEANGLSPQKRLAEAPNNYNYGSHQAFNAGDTIDGGWQEGFRDRGKLFYYTYFLFSSSYTPANWSSASGGNWLVGQTNFLGVELEKNGQMHYGWVRITRNSDDQLTIQDMAISDVPNVPILAGDTTVSNSVDLEDSRNALLQLLKGPEKLIIKSTPLISDFTVLIANTAGQTVWSGEGKPEETIEVSLIDWPRGTYVVLITTRKGNAKRWKIAH